MEYKQVILVRKDLKMPKGKLSVQCCHASLESALKVQKENKKLFEKWIKAGMKKIVLFVSTKTELLAFKKVVDQVNISNSIITDAGLTFFKKPTITCLGIGPAEESKLNKITKNLKLVQ